MPEALWISFAFGLGLLVKAVGLPPLVGYLAAGFVLSGISAVTEVTIEATDVLEHIAHLGVLLLLFTVGLKLKLRSIISREVIGGSLLHFSITCAVFTPGLYLLMELEWLIPLAITVSLSFVISAPLNRFSHSLYERFSGSLARFEGHTHHPDEQPISLGDTKVLVMGMGRTGTAAYDWLRQSEPELIGLDSDPAKTQTHQDAGRNVVFADAEDNTFWQGLHMPRLEAVILAMNDIEGKVIAARMLRRKGFTGYIVAHTMYADEAKKIRKAGADEAYLTMSETGVARASHLRDNQPAVPSQTAGTI